MKYLIDQREKRYFILIIKLNSKNCAFFGGFNYVTCVIINSNIVPKWK